MASESFSHQVELRNKRDSNELQLERAYDKRFQLNKIQTGCLLSIGMQILIWQLISSLSR